MIKSYISALVIFILFLSMGSKANENKDKKIDKFSSCWSQIEDFEQRWNNYAKGYFNGYNWGPDHTKTAMPIQVELNLSKERKDLFSYIEELDKAQKIITETILRNEKYHNNDSTKLEKSEGWHLHKRSLKIIEQLKSCLAQPARQADR